MSKIEALEKLRKSSHIDDDKWMLEDGRVVYIYNGLPNDSNAVNFGEQWRKIADEIEAEIAERYIESPVDGNGNVIDIGDKLIRKGKVYIVNALVWDGRIWWFTETTVSSTWIPTKEAVLFRRRTLEDVLEDFADAAADVDERDREEWEPLLAKYADEIREIMESGSYGHGFASTDLDEV